MVYITLFSVYLVYYIITVNSCSVYGVYYCILRNLVCYSITVKLCSAHGVYYCIWHLACYNITVKLCSAHGVYYCICIWRISCVLLYYSEVTQCAWCILFQCARYYIIIVLMSISLSRK